MRYTMSCAIAVALAATAPSIAQQQTLPPVIDVHMHVDAKDARWEARAANPITGVAMTAFTEDAHRRETLEQMDRHHVVLGVISNDGTPQTELHQRWMSAAPQRFLPAIGFNAPNDVSPAWIREQAKAGRIKVIGEIAAPYAGYSAGNAVYEPFFALAEELDIPIAVHVGSAGGGATYTGFPKYRMELNRPLLLEDMLARHPRARVQMMHAGWPFTDEAVALMKLHAQVYADLGVISWTQPQAEFHRHLQRLVEAGLAHRIMFGSDQMVWPESIGAAIAAVHSASFLSDRQKRDILCGNAARFLKLPPATCL